jgi:gamma-polyglutamate synthase
MYSSAILLVVLVLLMFAGIAEFIHHQKRINSIPIRIHINGTRGKSSVARLIGAGLRAGGISTITKVTGTFPRLILEDGTETSIYRKSGANIIEQLSIIKFAASRKPQALVIECMALQPIYQTITETKMIHSTIGVMTNVRYDHIEIMGYTLPEIAETLGRTIPQKGHLFSSENQIPEILKAIADKHETFTHLIDPATVTPEEMKGFDYIEHKENVSLALAVCQHAGIDRHTALSGMYQVIPDAGVLTRSIVRYDSKEIVFFNVFAANDPDSTLLIWKKLIHEKSLPGLKIVLLNTRQDRLERARQLSDLIAKKMLNEMDYLFLMGQSCELVESISIGYGIPKNKIINLGWAEPRTIFDTVCIMNKQTSSIFAIGNMGGKGAETVTYFKHLSIVA